MKYETTAKGLAALGRNGDDALIHVSKDELAGLQALLGPLSTNPHTGMPEAFNWGGVLGSVGIGLLGAMTGGAALAAAPEIGALGATAVGAGAGALGGGALSAAQGKGFGPGAIGGAISGGMGGFGGAELGGPAATPTTGAAPIESTAVNSEIAEVNPFQVAQPTAAGAPLTSLTQGPVSTLNQPWTMAGAKPNPFESANIPSNFSQLQATPVGGTAPTPGIQQFPTAPGDTGTPSYWDALKKQGSTMVTKQGAMDLLKPVGMGAVVGSTIQSSIEQNKANQQSQQASQDQANANAQDQSNYMSSLGFTLPDASPSTSKDTATQRNYYLNLLYPSSGYAAGGPIVASRTVMGVPVKTTFPAKYVDEFERTEDLHGELPQAMQGIQSLIGPPKNFANGGYLNNTIPAQEDPHPQSLIPKAAPQPGAAPVRQEVVGYDEGGFLDGPGDGMSDDIPANIDGQEEVRLADGEFVVPPEIVNMLGYGDPEKGAKMLDNLLPMIRQAAHGKKEQVKQDAGKKAVAKALGGITRQSGSKSLAAEKIEARKKK